MKAEKITLDGYEYLQIDLEIIRQKGRSFFVGKISAFDLVQLYTVRPTDYDAAKEASIARAFSDDDLYQSRVLSVQNPEKEKDFQRRFDQKRVSEIKDFLEEGEYPFFPNTIIANCELINDYEDFAIDEEASLVEFQSLENKPDHLSFLFRDHASYKLLVPYTKDAILIIDGQHRLRGLGECQPEVTKNYDLLISFIVGFDRSVIAQQFYTINYHQKPVNKSLLYHLTGEFSTQLDELTFLHHTVRILNELEESPFFQRVKMLGVNPPNATADEKTRLSISQAFLIDYLRGFISDRSIGSKNPPIFLYYYKRSEFHIEIIRFLIKYFLAVSQIHKDWDDPSRSLISKGMGVGAFLRALYTIFPIIFIKEWGARPEEIKNYTVENLTGILSKTSEIDFSREGQFGGVGSAGSINKIKNQILESISYKDSGEIDEFRQWLKANS